MPSLGSNNTTQTQTSVPWKFAQPGLKLAIKSATDLFNSGSGFNPFPGKGYVGMSDPTKQALGGIMQTAKGDNLGTTTADQWGSMLGTNAIGTEGDLRGLIGQNPNALAQYTTGIASGAQGIGTGGYDAMAGTGPNTEGDLRTLLGQTSNPYYANVVQNQSNNLADDITRQFAGVGGYGGSGHTAELAKQLGDFREKAMADQWDANNQMQRGLLGDITGVQQTNFGDTKSLQDAITGITGQNIGNRMAAAGNLSQEQQTGFGNTRGLLGDVSNVQGQNFADQSSLLGMAPQIQQMQYTPYQMEAGVGSAYDDLHTRKLQAAKDKFAAKDMADWNRLGAFGSSIGGPAGQFSTTNSTVTQPSNPFGMAIGAGLAAGQVASGIDWNAIRQMMASDRRLKKDIHLIGKTKAGLPIYTYRYKGTNGPALMGVMAQDVAKKQPEAVGTLPSGFMGVRYDMVA